jgi:adenylate kinase
MSKQNIPFNLIILGDPGAGKATQAAYIAKKYKMLDYDMGRELAILREKNQAIEKAQKQTADKGILTPTMIVRKINHDFITSAPKEKGILFDGHPKMLGEAKLISSLLKKTKRIEPLFIYLSIPQSEIIERVSKRQGYKSTGIRTRKDDTTEALKNRAKYYRKNIKEVVDFFSSKYMYKKISGVGTRTEVRAKIQKVIDQYLKTLNEKIH